MRKFNILTWLYKRAPMNFYTLTENSTIIKSINNTFLGYKFDKQFTQDELASIWEIIKLHKKISIIIIFVIFIILLYGVIYPNYYFIADKNWYLTSLPLLLIIFLIYQGIIILSTKHFEKKLKQKLGSYETTIFTPSNTIDTQYYRHFKIELSKALTLILLILLCFRIGSPFKIATKWIQQERYNDVIKLTTIGAKIFPIAPEWYSLRGYSNFNLKKYKEAIQDFDKAYKLGPDEYNVINFDNKIYIKYIIKEYESALEDFDHEIANASNEYEKDSFLWDKAQFLYNIKQYEDSLDVYNELLIKSEKDRIYLLQSRLYFERAQVYQKLGLTEEAQQDLINAETLSIEDSFKNPIPKPTLLINNM